MEPQNQILTRYVGFLIPDSFAKRGGESREEILKKQGGSLLVEVIVAISILAVGLLGIASMQVSSIRGNSTAMSVTEASCLSADRLEKLMSLPYSHSDLSAGNHADPSPPAGYTITWSVTDDFPLQGTKTVIVTTTWIDHGVSKSVSMQRVLPSFI
ncbi:MAG: hypothetical protein JRJ03_01990 [Deltaproteobacteria bacterium]|nr:hypothetical protein [Deltaproteobacteria bacterium]